MVPFGGSPALAGTARYAVAGFNAPTDIVDTTQRVATLHGVVWCVILRLASRTHVYDHDHDLLISSFTDLPGSSSSGLPKEHPDIR